MTHVWRAAALEAARSRGTLTGKVRYLLAVVCVAASPLVSILVYTGTAAAASGDGLGTMTVSPTSVNAASATSFVFTFGADATVDFNPGSTLTLQIPAGWTAPKTTSGAGQITLGSRPPTCASSSISSITGTGPWTVTITLACLATKGLTLTYASATAPNPVCTTTYPFTTQTAQSGGTLTPIATQPSVTVNASACKLAFTQQPTATTAGQTITPPVTVAVETSGGTVVTGSTAPITLAIGTNPSSGALGGTLTANAVNGVATFSNLTITKAGVGYTLTASSTGLTGATSSAFTINPPNAPSITSPASGTSTNAGTAGSPLTVSGTAPAGATVTLYNTNNCTSTVAATTTAPSGTWSTSDTTLNTGNQALSATSTDANNNVSACSTAVTISVDRTAPVISLAAPSATTTMPTFSGTAGILTGDLSSVTVKVYNGSNTTGTVAETLSTSRDPSTGAYSIVASPALVNGNTYTVQASQSDSAGNTGVSSAQTFTVSAGTVPGMPQNVSAIAGNAQASVTWNPPASNGGATITSYTLTIHGTGTTFSTTPGTSCTGTNPQCAYTVTGLNNGASYSFDIQAVNGIGTGAAATTATVTPTVGLCAGQAAASLALCGVGISSPFSSLMLNGLDQSDFATLSNLSVQDQQNATTGWKVTVFASQLACTSTDAGCPSAGDKLTANRLQMAGPLAAGTGGSQCISGCAQGTLSRPQGSAAFAIDTGDAGGQSVKIASYSGGDASYTLVTGTVDGAGGHNLQLKVPAGAYATTYHTTITITVASGP